jgi:hypothetical protein
LACTSVQTACATSVARRPICLAVDSHTQLLLRATLSLRKLCVKE